LRRLKDEYFSAMHRRVSGARKRDHEDVVLVPGGPFVAGAAAGVIGAFNMDDTDSPLRAADLPPFLVDRTVVTSIP
jgi:formylglycine-generating enzyme required for sulfatase activity